MPVANRNDDISEAEYLEAELSSEIKHEFVDGYIYAMAGASRNHVKLTGNVFAGFHRQLMNGPCEPYSSDMKVKTPTGQFRYPDVLVSCDNTFTHKGYVSETPVIIVEVLSHSTRRIDEQIKRLEYINIATLKEYVLIEQDFVDITVYRKSDDWRPTHYFLDESIYFESIGISLSVAEIYHRVENRDTI
ncbi:MAG: Uma2 family endonuclease [Phenylobacterium sp.]|jgi:Uma2 family endonuclease